MMETRTETESQREKRTEDDKDRDKNKDKEERKDLAREIRSELGKLTSSERWLCKALFGFTAAEPPLSPEHHEPSRDGLKSPDSACLYVFESLWPSGLTEDQRENEQKPFPLKNLIPDKLSTIFHHDLASIKDMFREGRNMNDISQTSFIRSFQRFNKVYAHDLAVKPSGYTRTWISGSVSK